MGMEEATTAATTVRRCGLRLAAQLPAGEALCTQQRAESSSVRGGAERRREQRTALGRIRSSLLMRCGTGATVDYSEGGIHRSTKFGPKILRTTGPAIGFCTSPDCNNYRDRASNLKRAAHPLLNAATTSILRSPSRLSWSNRFRARMSWADGRRTACVVRSSESRGAKEKRFKPHKEEEHAPSIVPLASFTLFAVTLRRFSPHCSRLRDWTRVRRLRRAAWRRLAGGHSDHDGSNRTTMRRRRAT